MTTAPKSVRVAAYCRKSHAQGLQQEFNSIHAQRDAIQHFVASQREAGWVLLDTDYSDGGYSGANLERPGFQRLMKDITERKVDCVAVYRLDRLSRSIVDYLSLLRMFEEQGVTFVSVTEQFNTTTPVGRLVLNQLILFAQFEREVISERVRDKLQATRRRGDWTGGKVVLGYKVVDKRLVVEPDEAEQVLATFRLFLELGTLRRTVEELARRDWRNKASSSVPCGYPLSKASLNFLLRNPLYIGLIRAGKDLVPGRHEAIVPREIWTAVQEQLEANRVQHGSQTRNKTGALLRGIFRCKRCGSAMVHEFSTKGTKRHRYYVCRKLRAEGAKSCPGARVSAGKFETFVIGQLCKIGVDEALMAETALAVENQAASRMAELDAEQRRAQRQKRRFLEVAAPGAAEQEGIGALDARLADIEVEREALDQTNESILREAMQVFTPVWEHLFPAERERILRLLFEQVIYDPDTGETEIELRPGGVEALTKEAVP